MGIASRYMIVVPWFRQDDIVAPHRMSAPMIRDIMLDSNHTNLLAMVFFVAKHADADARARCTFVSFPAPHDYFDQKEGRRP